MSKLVARQSNAGSPWSGNSSIYFDIEDNINGHDNQSQIRTDSWNPELRRRLYIDALFGARSRLFFSVTFEWTFVITNSALEVISTVLDQLSSVNNSGYAIVGMSISFAAMLICIVELIYKGKKENVTWRWKESLPWFYHPLPSELPFGTFKDIIGFVCALCQCIVTTINYLIVNRAIKISVWPIIFAFGLLCSKFIENPDQKATA
ncbi:hypothetical protein ACOSP7_004167 [Xanthoceras sorbifolium]